MVRRVTADPHWGHKNICGPDGFVPTRRAFDTPDLMNEHIISEWNKVVMPEDEVIIAGDLSMNLAPAQVFHILTRLHGTLILIEGNHDSKPIMDFLKKNNYDYVGKPKFEFNEVGIKFKHNKRLVHVTHYPLGLGAQRTKLVGLCGHIHDNATKEPNLLNIGMDSPELGEGFHPVPITIDEALQLVENKIEAVK